MYNYAQNWTRMCVIAYCSTIYTNKQPSINILLCNIGSCAPPTFRIAYA